jgi:hypothetical protein
VSAPPRCAWVDDGVACDGPLPYPSAKGHGHLCDKHLAAELALHRAVPVRSGRRRRRTPLVALPPITPDATPHHADPPLGRISRFGQTHCDLCDITRGPPADCDCPCKLCRETNVAYARIRADVKGQTERAEARRLQWALDAKAR